MNKCWCVLLLFAVYFSLWAKRSKEVLSFAACEASPFDGMLWTSVVATETEDTLVAPLWTVVGKGDVGIWTGLDTSATTSTGVGGLEMTGSDEETVEERTDDMALGPLQRTWYSVEFGTAVYDAVDDGGHAVACRGYLVLFLVLGVGVETW